LAPGGVCYNLTRRASMLTRAKDSLVATADVSIVITNYNTGPYLERCVRSIFAQSLGGRRCEIVVVENASFVDQEPHLRAVASQGARVLRLPTNVGHGIGCNRGMAQTTGRFVFFVNSDIVACPGALMALLAVLETRDDAGLVEPRTWFDDDRAFCIPEVPTPTPLAATLDALARFSPRMATALSLRHTRRSLRSWQAKAPLGQAHLTGAFLGARRDVLRDLAGYDESYPLYYEDSDLFARVRRRGLQLLLVPGADVIHYSHRSVAQIWDEAMAKARIGRALYLRRHHGRLAQWWDACLERATRKASARPSRPQPRPLDLGTLADPPTFEVPASTRSWLLELALDPYCALSTGRLCTEPRAVISARTWQSLYATTYFLRALDLDTWRVLGAWRFVKA
jgi:GT2 family glycosyltransferase